eukprot:jgi/Chrzof1/5527/Cz16g06120.t1
MKQSCTPLAIDKLPLSSTHVRRYYVRKCNKPKQRAALGLAVKVGSVVEADTEQGVAHIVEHLAFNATEGYSNHDIVKFLESVGASFGACQNAHTSADETVYSLVVPCDSQELLDQSISVLAEFAFRIRCDPGDLAKERGAVMEEWRMQRDTAGRTQSAHWKLMLQGSRYADRLPIGLESIIRNVSADTVKAFYKRWYRPENMAVVVVGDFEDTDLVVNSIKTHMGSGKSEGPAVPIPAYNWVPHSEPRFCAFADKEAQDSVVYVSFKVDRRLISTPAEFIEHLKDLLFQQCFNSRLYRLSRAADPPFFMASVGDEGICRGVDAYVLTAVAKEGQTLRALEAALLELARVRLHGFSDKEVALAMRTIEADIESTYLERDQSYCFDVRDEYVRHFLQDEFVTGQEYEARLTKTLLPRISRADVESRADRYKPSCSAVFKSVEHKKYHNEAAMRAVVDKVIAIEQARSLEPWQQLDTPDRLMHTEPAPGEIVSERYHEDLAAYEVVLSNGMRVCWKETNFMEDEVMVSGTAAGGLSEVPQHDFYTASMSSTIAAQLGAYGHKPEVLNDILAGKRVEMQWSEGAYVRMFKGSASPSDLQELFQLIHLLLTTR